MNFKKIQSEVKKKIVRVNARVVRYWIEAVRKECADYEPMSKSKFKIWYEKELKK